MIDDAKFEVRNRMVYDLRSGEPVATTRGLDDIRCAPDGYVPPDPIVREALAFYEQWRIDRLAAPNAG